MKQCLLIALALMGGWCRTANCDEAKKPISFYRQVRPILQRHCSGCHQPAKASGNLQLVSFDLLKTGGENGAAFAAGHPDDSVIVKAISGEKPAMPPNGDPLTRPQVETIRTWILQGATDDTPAAAKEEISQDKPPVYNSAPVITALAFSPDSSLLAVSGYHEVLLHQADGGAIVGRLVGRSPKITSIQFSPDGKKLAAAGGAPPYSVRFNFGMSNSGS